MSGAREVLMSLPIDQKVFDAGMQTVIIDKALADLRASVEWPEEKSTEGENYDIYNKHDLDGSFNEALKLCKEAFMEKFK